jgi:hypothetical protein
VQIGCTALKRLSSFKTGFTNAGTISFFTPLFSYLSSLSKGGELIPFLLFFDQLYLWIRDWRTHQRVNSISQSNDARIKSRSLQICLFSFFHLSGVKLTPRFVLISNRLYFQFCDWSTHEGKWAFDFFFLSFFPLIITIKKRQTDALFCSLLIDSTSIFAIRGRANAGTFLILTLSLFHSLSTIKGGRYWPPFMSFFIWMYFGFRNQSPHIAFTLDYRPNQPQTRPGIHSDQLQQLHTSLCKL